MQTVELLFATVHMHVIKCNCSVSKILIAVTAAAINNIVKLLGNVQF